MNNHLLQPKLPVTPAPSISNPAPVEVIPLSIVFKVVLPKSKVFIVVVPKLTVFKVVVPKLTGFKVVVPK